MGSQGSEYNLSVFDLLCLSPLRYLAGSVPIEFLTANSSLTHRPAPHLYPHEKNHPTRLRHPCHPLPGDGPVPRSGSGRKKAPCS